MKLSSLIFGSVLIPLSIFASFPATTNYSLQSYSFGSGGSAGSATATYSLEGETGGNSGQSTSTINTTLKPGFIQTQQANVPQIATLDNGSGLFYNKLHFVLDNQSNPTDALFLVSVSTDNFTSNITYLQPDGTLSSSLLLSDYQTYTAFGGVTGSYIIGLTPSTTYYVRALATNGQFTESQYGPAASQATAAPTLSFSLTTSTQSVGPYSVDLGSLLSGQITTSTQTINTNITTNGASGGDVYVSSLYGGLHSPSTSYTINSSSGDLSLSPDGYGAQATSTSTSSGGPLNIVGPFNVSGNSVGALSQIMQSIFSSSSPLGGGVGQLVLKAKSSSTDVSSTDYQDILTFVAAGNF